MSENKNQKELDRYYFETLEGYENGAKLLVEPSENGGCWIWSLTELTYDTTIEQGTASTYEEAIKDGRETWCAYCQILYEAMEDIRK